MTARGNQVLTAAAYWLCTLHAVLHALGVGNLTAHLHGAATGPAASLTSLPGWNNGHTHRNCVSLHYALAEY